jgi:ubiquinone/menaquinone biosynthesis C-methylase UbiE
VAARHDRVAVDIGTGSGSAVLRRAAREPQTLFIAIDADGSAMADASRRAARPARRGGASNVVFVVSAAEQFPADLCAVADEVAVTLPWGSLLDAVLRPECATFARIRRVLKQGGEMTLLVSAQERDQLHELDEATAHDLADRYVAAGFDVIECRPATRADVELLSSGWGRRLAIPERRQAWLFRLRQRRRLSASS